MTLTIATAAYPAELLPDFAAYAAKITAWVEEAAAAGADICVFPEYAAMELAGLAGADVARDRDGATEAVAQHIDEAWALHARLAQRLGVHIVAGSAPVRDQGRLVNRAMLFTPEGARGAQDKQIMTLWERDPWGVEGQGPLTVFETALGRIAILICYDSEFPLLGRALCDADVLIVPSCTETLAGYWRVRIGAQARALEAQCVAVMASMVGDAPDLYGVEETTGAGGIFGPPDIGFPDTGVLATGALGVPGWTFAEVDPDAIAEVRRAGGVRNRAHWDEQAASVAALRTLDLRNTP